MEYSREESKTDEANSSEAVLGIWSCNILVREHQGSAVRACNVPIQNTKPRDHDVRPDPRPLAPCPRRSLAKNRQKLLLPAPEGAGREMRFIRRSTGIASS